MNKLTIECSEIVSIASKGYKEFGCDDAYFIITLKGIENEKEIASSCLEAGLLNDYLEKDLQEKEQKIIDLEKKCSELEEYKFMYEGLCK